MNTPIDFTTERLRRRPIVYTVEIVHFIDEDDCWKLGASVSDVQDSSEDRRRVAADLRKIADWLESE